MDWSLLVAVLAAIGGLVVTAMNWWDTREADKHHSAAAELVKRLELQSKTATFALPSPKGGPGSSTQQLHAEQQAIKLRLAAIEARLPSEDTIDRIASANEARLAAKVEHLEKDLARLEAKSLGYGAIYSAVFAVIAVLAGIVAVIPWVLGKT